MISSKVPLSVLVVSMALAYSGHALADSISLQEAVETAVLGNPEVGSQFHDFQSSLEGQNVGFGRLLPEVNVEGWTGREWRGSNDYGLKSSNWSRSGYNLGLRQLLFDGFSTINDWRQLGFEKLAGFYGLRSTVDGVALDAAAAYLDVQRYREQVVLADENYRLHKDVFKQISDRSFSGVGRGVDEVQAQARLALAQTNVMTANGNLNDVTQRYQRIIGKAPAETLLDAPDIHASIPQNPADFAESVRVNPSVLAKQSLVRAAEYGVDSAKGKFAPTIELRANTGRDQNEPAVFGSTRNQQSSNVQVVANFNLFRGGSDAARVRQTAAQMYAQRDLRDYTCRNVQQELSVAYNNIVRMREQMPFLEAHVRDSAQVRVAYMQQFQIGQRTLLDLLNTENELFDARQTLTNAKYDLRIMELRWLSMSSRILAELGLADPYQDQLPDEAAKLQFPDEMLQACLTPLPNVNSLKPVEVRYQDGNKPPVLTPVSSDKAASSWN